MPRDDLVDLIIEAIKNPSFNGAYNGTAPKPVTMAQLCSSVGGVLGRPSWLPVPDFAITTLLGEGAQVCDGWPGGQGAWQGQKLRCL
jgi:NAD dependent epimerase/dehydratase family enzyme